ncbi:MAG: hypothetical protein A2729_00705 [Candidatus Buchananbacteria bacterium RIFCSPHIGHO2_01_FULL_39_14]|uniref:Uncharacterized protein n=2 Tax=Candidatus Buchananiibacteriota TaxID=1817903 RepID=A0A1G1YQH2_9BACT|nr:MAG: hypothetical protein A2729_00705 [Candidatus Buchananbacteria bacterium RIFCSPHIGHO2_01_FULL_39_14]OGY48687.1 MAG: hypothetical protein A3D39_04400 [Candidatus Buchananbacteria bacterium RIFCSPHIGHO2_02_FULL_39_17]OGY54539.1 MAG: hypothetical protein A2912_00315 [Candidatus Buchananbacteria bacterium RIFCSPLOWO2_01_FULL_40_23b]
MIFFQRLFRRESSSLQSGAADPSQPWTRLVILPGESEPRRMNDDSPVNTVAELINQRLKMVGADPKEPTMPTVDPNHQ